MLEIQYEKFGPPSVVAKCIKVPDLGEPSAWDAIVEVEACPINPSDVAMLAGQYGKLNKPPAKIGMEASGVIRAIGESVEGLAVGDRVMVMANDNWAQRRKVPASLLQKVPNELDPLQVALMKVNPATALLMLRSQKIGKKDWVIQNAPLSNVGRAVIQVASCQNIRTINIVRRPDAVQEVKDLGGDIVIEDGDDLESKVRESIGREKIKLALDAVGGKSTGAMADCLDKGGKVINYGMLAGEPCQIRPDHLIFRDIELTGFWLSKIVNRMSHQERVELYDDVIEMMLTGKVHGRIDSCFKLSEISDALRRAESPDRRGKVMILPNGNIDSSLISESSISSQSKFRQESL
ncbi:MAG: zinc-dependent alcohol dehydrogenase family protein [Mariniblastus sp.]